MGNRYSGAAVLVVVIWGSVALAQGPAELPPAEESAAADTVLAQAQPAPKEADQPPGPEAPPPPEGAPAAGGEPDAFAQAPAPGGQAPTGYNPQMIGDFPFFFGVRAIPTPPSPSTSSSSSSSPLSSSSSSSSLFGGKTYIRTPIVTSGGSKIAENESPLPDDRVFVTYNYYSHVSGPPITSSLTIPATPPTTITIPAPVIPGFPPLPPTVITVPGAPAFTVPFPTLAARVNVHRETFGFEKTFLDGDASVELRVPVDQLEGSDASNEQGFGDLTVILKYALLRDRAGDVLSAGLAVTAPTGPIVRLQTLTVPPGDVVIHPTLLQPFVGGLWTSGRTYVQGFSSVMAPTDQRDVTLLFNDLGVGYHLYRSEGEALLTAVTPTLEFHVTTPLNHRGADDLVRVPDILDVTEGVHFGLGTRANLTVGVATPLTGPKPFDLEAIVELNWHF